MQIGKARLKNSTDNTETGIHIYLESPLVLRVPHPLQSKHVARCLIRSPQHIIIINPTWYCKVPRILRQIIARLKSIHSSVHISVLQLAIPRPKGVIGRQLVSRIQHQCPIQNGPVVPSAVNVSQIQRFLQNPNRVHELKPKILHHTHTISNLLCLSMCILKCNKPSILFSNWKIELTHKTVWNQP